jgi:hypothetical protein
VFKRQKRVEESVTPLLSLHSLRRDPIRVGKSCRNRMIGTSTRRSAPGSMLRSHNHTAAPLESRLSRPPSPPHHSAPCRGTRSSSRGRSQSCSYPSRVSLCLGGSLVLHTYIIAHLDPESSTTYDFSGSFFGHRAEGRGGFIQMKSIWSHNWTKVRGWSLSKKNNDQNRYK